MKNLSEENELRAALYAQVIVFMRQRHPDIIDAAYDYFWEEDYPEDFLHGVPLELGFINFEDWLICDYRLSGKDGQEQSVTDLYLEESGQGGDQEKSAALLALKRSFISLYEARTVEGASIGLEDVFSGRTYAFSKTPFEGLSAGSLFAARVVEFDGGKNVMGGCIYPFPSSMRQVVLDSVDRQFARYRKNKNPDGAISDFLKDESYVFNTIWTSNLYRRS